MTEPRLGGRLIALGVTGSIAAYKSAELARRLMDEGAELQVLLSRSGREFIGPLTFEALTRRKVMSDPLELLADGRIGHIVVADSADAIVVAPATARWIAAMAAGLADDVITATCLASAAPVVVAPAMDGEMFRHPATQANITRLREFGYTIVPPEKGALASGQRGIGRLASTEAIIEATIATIRERPIRAPEASARPPVEEAVREPDLGERRVVVTAGGTLEPIDPVRFIGNRSSGRMGVAVAEAALGRGAQVTLIAGSVSVPLPEQAMVVRVETTEALRAAVLDALPGADVLIMAAAVADFRPRRTLTRKLERGEQPTLELESTPDILAEASRLVREQGVSDGSDQARTRRPVLVGFAAETGSLERASAKLASKGVDLLVANDVSQAGSGFGSDTNQVTLLGSDGSVEAWPVLPKREVAERILDRVAALLDAGPQTAAPSMVSAEARR
jgi:phosphopantothenoylcysteine decarboxylase/phosphopantothenate--cysteine ligase